LIAKARRLAAGENQDHSERGSLPEKRDMRIGKPSARADFKAKLLAKAAPRSFEVGPFIEDLRMIEPASPENPTTRILLRDGGWCEIDTVTGVVRKWGPVGRAEILAAALAEAGGWRTDILTMNISTARRKISRTDSADEAKAVDLAKWWHERGYVATNAPDGTWISIGMTRIRDNGDRMEIHGAVSDDVVRAIITKAREAWGGGVELDGVWTQEQKDRVWLEAQRQGVTAYRCEPSAAARRQWEREKTEIDARMNLRQRVRSAVHDAADLLAGARGDREALIRLPANLSAFVGSYLDDTQRTELAKANVADVILELDRFRELGDQELVEVERRKDSSPRLKYPEPAAGPDNVPSPGPR
jgi:hypothetical protein